MTKVIVFMPKDFCQSLFIQVKWGFPALQGLQGPCTTGWGLMCKLVHLCMMDSILFPLRCIMNYDPWAREPRFNQILHHHILHHHIHHHNDCQYCLTNGKVYTHIPTASMKHDRATTPRISRSVEVRELLDVAKMRRDKMEKCFSVILFTSCVSGRGNIFGGVCVCVCLFVLCRLNRSTYGPKIWHTSSIPCTRSCSKFCTFFLYADVMTSHDVIYT